MKVTALQTSAVMLSRHKLDLPSLICKLPKAQVPEAEPATHLEATTNVHVLFFVIALILLPCSFLFVLFPKLDASGIYELILKLAHTPEGRQIFLAIQSMTFLLTRCYGNHTTFRSVAGGRSLSFVWRLKNYVSHKKIN